MLLVGNAGELPDCIEVNLIPQIGTSLPQASNHLAPLRGSQTARQAAQRSHVFNITAYRVFEVSRQV